MELVMHCTVQELRVGEVIGSDDNTVAVDETA